MLIAIVGVRSQGKSTLGLYFARDFDLLIVLDPRSQFPVGRDGEIYEYATGDRNLLDLISERHHVKRFIVRPVGNLADAAMMLGADIAELLAANPDLRLAVIIDEAGTSTMRKVLNLDPWDQLFRTHPRKTAYFFLCAHRPIDTPTNPRSLIDWWCCFRVNMPDDLDMMEKACGPLYAEKLANLAPREWLLYDTSYTDEKDRIVEYRDPDVWFVPLDSPQVMTGPRPVPS